MSTVKAANLQNTGSGAPVFKNSSGTEIGQLVKAWVNFNGAGTVAINDSFNVASLTDNGTGDYTVTFTNAMANANYCVATSSPVTSDQGSAYSFGLRFTGNPDTGSPTTKTTAAIRLMNRRGADVDIANANVVVFGD